MILKRSRFVVGLLSALMVLSLSGLPQTLAATTDVKGKIQESSVAIPDGSTVRAISAEDGSIVATVTMGPERTFEFPKLEEGSYRFQVVTPDGTVVSELSRAEVGPGGGDVAMRTAAPEGEQGGSGGSTGVSASQYWWFALALIPVIIVVAADDDDDDDDKKKKDGDVSPSNP